MTSGTDDARLLELLRASDIFGDLEPGHLQQIAGWSREQAWPAEHVVFRQNEPDTTLYLLLGGMVALETYVPGRGHVTIQTLGPGDVLGWSSAVPQVRTKTASARTLGPTRAIAIDAEALQEGCDRDHDLGYHVYRALGAVIASRLKVTRLQLLDIFSIGAPR
jgi:CRP-like cAMP-binding protein